VHATKVDEEIERLETHARVLRRLREAAYGGLNLPSREAAS